MSSNYSAKTPPISLENLPQEVIARILHFTAQTGALSLAYVCKSLAAACLPRIYDTVVVDAQWTSFNKEHRRSATYIHLLRSFRLLARTYKGLFPLHNLYIVELPELFNAYDEATARVFDAFFARLVCLRELVWLLYGFRLAYLARVPADILRRVKVNTRFSVGNSESTSIVKSRFPHLQALSLGPVPIPDRLVELLRQFLSDPATRLSSLELSIHDERLAALVYLACELADGSSFRETSTGLSAVFQAAPAAALAALTSLSLDHMLVCAQDARHLVRSVDLARLTMLRLSHISEYETRTNAGPDKPGFLARIASQLRALKHLCLDFRETQRDSVGPFLRRVGNPAGLDSLDLTVRINDVQATHVDVEAMYMLHLSALQRHRALRTLALDFRTESAYGDAAAPAPPALMESLANFGRITGLRLSSGHNAPRNQLVCVLQRLPYLRYLDDCGVGGGGVLSLGNAVGHVDASDEWIAVQNVALLYHLAQPNVQYVRVDKYIFECRHGEVMHRKGIERWFLERVRGCLEGLTWRG